MSDINELRKLAGLTKSAKPKKKLDEHAMGMDCNVSQTVSYREETELDHFMKIIKDAEAGNNAPQKLDEMVVSDLSNGYGNHHSAEGDDYFPSGEHGSVSKRAGPASAKQGDNPLQKATKDEVHEELVHAYRNFITE